MLTRARSSFFFVALLVACLAALFAACDDSANSSSTSSGTGSGTGSGGSMASSSTGFGVGGSTTQSLTIDPPTATITITSKGAPATQSFVAKSGDTVITSGVTWTLDTYAQGNIDASGAYTTLGLVGGKVKVTATLGKDTATAELTVNVKVSEDVSQSPTDPGVNPANHTALEGAPMPDPGAGTGNATKILYPYDKTVMPRGLTAPLLQFSPGSLPPEDAKVTIKSTYFEWNGFIHLQNAGVPQFYMPQDVWDAALLSTGGQTLIVDVTKAAAGVAYGPAETSIIVADGSLKGAVYYMTYETPGNGLYVVRPGVKQPANLLIQGCVVCHSVSSGGTRLATGADDASFAAQAGVYTVDTTGTAKHVSTSPPGLGGDSRGLSMATFTSDGNYVMRSQSNFWGGINQLAWKVDATNNALVPANVVGLGANVSAYLPAISHDGKHYAFTNGAGEPTAFGTPSRSISLMDLMVDTATDTLTFSNRKLLLDNGAAGSVAKFVTFLPDPNFIVLQEGEGYTSSYGYMLPTWGPNSSYDTTTGRLYMLNAATNEHIELATMNAGNATIDKQRNYEPFALPVTAGGYMWVVFTSIREYGNTYSGSNVRKQLWVGAISTNPQAGQDPSHPPFYLPNQSATRNERGFWALEPCKSDGASCDTGDECCNGFCRPSDPNDPLSPKVCEPPSGGCSQISEKCDSDADCCDVGGGAHCIGGFCTQPPPQ
ncbi:MAG: hypothetical protein U0414_20425 [Polyangiaceae bacterium]